MDRHAKPLIMESRIRKIAKSSLLIALALSTNYALISIPNVKLMDSVVFVSSYCMGAAWGLLVTLGVWLVYGSVNPLGANLITLLFVITGELVYVGFARVAHLMQKTNPIVLGMMGGLSTLIYDLYTNSLVGIFFYGSVWVGILSMNFPVPMGLLHEASNVVFFSTAVPVLIALLIRGRSGTLG